jgi:hypothetical protein
MSSWSSIRCLIYTLPALILVVLIASFTSLTRNIVSQPIAKVSQSEKVASCSLLHRDSLCSFVWSHRGVYNGSSGRWATAQLLKYGESNRATLVLVQAKIVIVTSDLLLFSQVSEILTSMFHFQSIP